MDKRRCILHLGKATTNEVKQFTDVTWRKVQTAQTTRQQTMNCSKYLDIKLPDDFDDSNRSLVPFITITLPSLAVMFDLIAAEAKFLTLRLGIGLSKRSWSARHPCRNSSHHSLPLSLNDTSSSLILSSTFFPVYKQHRLISPSKSKGVHPGLDSI